LYLEFLQCFALLQHVKTNKFRLRRDLQTNFILCTNGASLGSIFFALSLVQCKGLIFGKISKAALAATEEFF
jgi:hypothetical protein